MYYAQEDYEQKKQYSERARHGNTRECPAVVRNQAKRKVPLSEKPEGETVRRVVQSNSRLFWLVVMEIARALEIPRNMTYNVSSQRIERTILMVTVVQVICPLKTSRNLVAL